MELHLHPHPLWLVPYISEPHICCLRATGQVREAGRGFACPPEQGPVSIPPHLFGPLFLLWWQEGRGFSALRGAASCCLCVREGRVLLHQSNSLSHFRMLLNLSTSSFSSATRLSRSFTCSHRTQLPSSQAQFHSRFSPSFPQAAQGDGEWGLWSVHHTLSLPIIPPQGEDFSHSSPAPA